MPALHEGSAGLGQGGTIESAAMNGDSTTALQQPTDHRSGPDRDAAVVEETQFDRPWQRLEQGGRLSGNAVPEQIRQHQGVPGAGVMEGDQQRARSRLLCGKGLGKPLNGIPAAQFQALHAKHQR